MQFFFFGLLRDADMREVVLGRCVPAGRVRPARLSGARLATLRGYTYPVLVRDAGLHVTGSHVTGSHVPGVVVEELTAEDIARISFYESVEYAIETVAVDLADGGSLEARVFATAERGAVDDRAWRLEDWTVRDKTRDLHEARLWMALYGRLDVEEADRLWDETIAAGRTIEDLVEQVCGDPADTRL